MSYQLKATQITLKGSQSQGGSVIIKCPSNEMDGNLMQKNICYDSCEAAKDQNCSLSNSTCTGNSNQWTRSYGGGIIQYKNVCTNNP